MEEAATTLRAILSPNDPALLSGDVLQLVRLQTALAQRTRARESAERSGRLRRYLRRRRAFLLSSIAAVLSLVASLQRPALLLRDRRSYWAATDRFDDDEWKSQFRVSRATFAHLLKLLGVSLRSRRKHYLVPIDPRRRLAVALWWFARAEEYRCIAELFGVGIATVCMIVRQVTSAIVERLYRRFLTLPSGQQLDDALRAFSGRCCPQCAGAIGATHIPIAPPRENPAHYLNRRGWHSVILQAVVDHRFCFTDVSAGWPGSMDSAMVLSSSNLYLKAEDRADSYLFPREKSVMSGGVEIPVHLIGDASFPLKPWLMKAYTKEQQWSAERRLFSFLLGSARSVVDTSLNRLKGRWRCLLKRSDIHVTMMPRVVAACCILHNICELRGDAFLPEWGFHMAPCGSELIQPEAEPYGGDGEGAAEQTRNAIASNLLSILQ